MPEALSSFLFSVAIIVAVALFVPCIESITKLVRRHSELEKQTMNAESTGPNLTSS